MAAKSSISLVSVQKPTANTPILQRRNKLTANIDQQITKIGSFREASGSPVSNSGSTAAPSISNCDMASSHSSWRRARARLRPRHLTTWSRSWTRSRRSPLLAVSMTLCRPAPMLCDRTSRRQRTRRRPKGLNTDSCSAARSTPLPFLF
jgi:hypothetical protein